MFIKQLNIFIFCITCRFVFGQVLLNIGNGAYDVDGNFYNSVILSNGQEWITANLNTTHFSDGTAIPLCLESTVWSNATTPCYSYYQNSLSQAAIYGKLYNFFTANNPRNVCPSGWRVPTQLDWTNLTQALGGLGNSGGKLKSEGYSNWAEPNFLATDEILFNALPNGCRYDGGNYNNLSFYSFFWASTELDTTFGWYRALKYSSDATIRDYSKKQSGYAIRCMRDAEMVGLKKFDEYELFVTPNPAKDVVQVKTNIPFYPNALIRVYDFNGRTLLSIPFSSGILDITAFSPGLYMLEIEDGPHKRYVKMAKE